MTVSRSTQRVLDLLEVVLGAGSINLTAAAAEVDLTPTTALRHLRALEARGYLDRGADGQFSAGPVIYRLAASLRADGELDRLVAAAQPLLDQLALATGESAYLAVSDGRQATYVATAESERAIRHVGWVGQVVQFKGTAVGEALSAPGRVVSRVGAVEPDTTAVSLAAGTFAKLGVAISVIGPASRLGAKQRKVVGKELTLAANELIRVLEIDTKAAS